MNIGVKKNLKKIILTDTKVEYDVAEAYKKEKFDAVKEQQLKEKIKQLKKHGEIGVSQKIVIRQVVIVFINLNG